MIVLRSTGWDGPPPARGDLVTFDDGTWARIDTVAAGPGIGQWTLTADRHPGVPPTGGPNVYRWRGAPIL